MMKNESFPSLKKCSFSSHSHRTPEALQEKLLPYGSKVLFDKKVKFRALKPWEKGYIKEDIVKDGYKHIAIMEV